MSPEEFQQTILQLPSFSANYRKVLAESVKREFSGFWMNPENESTVDWKYLLFAASVLALSKNEKCQDSALRIAHSCLTRTNALDEERSACAVILNELSNHPGIALAIKRNLLKQNALEQIPAPLQIDRINRDFDNSVVNEKSELVFLNQFQSEAYSKAHKTAKLSISAPTSAGKSFFLSYLTEEFLANNLNGKICYLVPTRALISQVEADLTDRIVEAKMKGVFISSVPRLPNAWNEKRLIYVLTQERVNWLLAETPPEFKFDLLIVDEAQKISDGYRGIVLQQALSRLSRSNSGLRTIFSSPLAENPELLLQQGGITTDSGKIISDYVAVNQNLVWVDQVFGKPKLWKVSLCSGSDMLELGSIALSKNPGAGPARLAHVAFRMGGDSGILLYADIPSEAEKVANVLWNLSESDASADAEIEDLIKVIKANIHKDYLLVKVLRRRIAFHYGNMPTSIRIEIERLFKSGKIRFLVCTATLIEGVNLGARSIFLRGPKKGRRLEMNEVDFWNLAGRAGRLGSDFQGNIVCVDVSQNETWDFAPPRKRSRYKIREASDLSAETVEKIVKYVSEGTPRDVSNREPFLDYALTHYLFESYDGKQIQMPSLAGTNDSLVKEFQVSLEGIKSKITIPKAILERNPGVSPLAQESLLAYFRGYQKPLEELIPVSPKVPDAAKNSYLPLLQRIFTHLSGDHPRIAFSKAILVVNWTRGLPLAAIISNNIDYWITHGKSIPAIIRDTMDEVEQFARFKFAKYSSCYLDVLRYFFLTQGRNDLAEKIPNLHMWLEFGSYQETLISLMSLGFSRTAAIAISPILGDDDLSRDQCAKKLGDLHLDSLGFGKAVNDEINRILGLISLQ